MDEDYSTSRSSTAAMNEGSVEETITHTADEHETDPDANTQQSLTHAAVAVNESLRRLEQLRDRIAELTHRASSDNPHTHIPNASVGPAHAAIVLSDAMADTSGNHEVVPDMPRPPSTISADIMERLVEYEASIRPRLISSEVGGNRSSNSRDSTTQQPSAPSDPAPTQTYLSRTRPPYRPPPYPDLVIPPPRRSWLELSLSRRRDTNPDDGSTVLGRRVAARAAAGGRNSSEGSPSEFEQIILNRTTAIARDLQSMSNLLASRRVELLEQSRASRVSEAPRSANGDSPASDSANGDVLQPEEGRVSSRMANFFPHRPARIRRYRFGQATGETELQSEDPERVDYPPVPSTFNPGLRRITHDERDRPFSRSAGMPFEQLDDGRSYLVRRRLNADGEEQVHNINLSDWDEDDMEWAMPPMSLAAQGQPETRTRAAPFTVSRNILPPAPPIRSYIGPRSRVNGSQADMNQFGNSGPTAPVPLTRRRGWARLDANGNDITTDEEEELEQTRAQSRVRTLAQNFRSSANMPTSLSPIELGATARETLIPMTRNSVTHTQDDDGVIIARVRINPPRQTDLSTFPVPMDFTDAVQTPASAFSSRPTFGSYCSFQPELLPMPLADMIPSPVLHTPNPRIVNVHKYANLAGR